MKFYWKTIFLFGGLNLPSIKTTKSKLCKLQKKEQINLVERQCWEKILNNKCAKIFHLNYYWINLFQLKKKRKKNWWQEIWASKKGRTEVTKGKAEVFLRISLFYCSCSNFCVLCENVLENLVPLDWLQFVQHDCVKNCIWKHGFHGIGNQSNAGEKKKNKQRRKRWR